MNRQLLLHLHLIGGVGPATIQKIIQSKHKASLYDLTALQIQHMYGLPEKIACTVAQGLANKALLEKELELIQKDAIQWVTILDETYPSLLKHIYCPPSVLYVQGANLGTFNKTIALVGSRKAHHYAQQTIGMLVPSLVDAGWTVVSGGALGADTMAHKQTLQQQGNTIAVLGSGLLQPYPSSNKRLFKTIIQQSGSVVSPYPLTMDAYPGNFPARNRIIAGLSHACIVVQAAAKSGACITAEYTLDQGKSVFTIPGSIFDPLSAGCHALIKEGATIITTADDLLIELGESYTISKKDKQNSQVLSAHASVEEKIVFYCMGKPCSIDELCQQLDIEIDELQTQLFNLQLAGKIEQNAVGLWQVI